MMFKNENYQFDWKDVGDIELGRPNLGNLTSVVMYRLAQYTMRAVLIQNYGVEETNKLLFKAGKLAGGEFCKKFLNIEQDINSFINSLYNAFIELKVGVIRIEDVDVNNLNMVLTISEDLDCSGLPVTDETVCDYDEGFLSGVLSVYLKKEFSVKEVDCWSTGDRTCRFKIKPAE